MGKRGREQRQGEKDLLEKLRRELEKGRFLNKKLVVKLLLNPRARRIAIRLLKSPTVRRIIIKQVKRQLRRG